VDIGSSFGYMFQDQDWPKKIIVGGLISLVPILNFAALGYLVQVIRNVRDGQALPLPEWDQLGEHFGTGLYVFLIFLVYSIPIILLACIQSGASIILGSAAEGRTGADAAASLFSLISICMSCLIGLWALVIGVLSPAILVRFADTSEFRSGLQLGELVSIIRANPGSYLIAMIVVWVVLDVIAPLGLLACGVGVIVTGFWAMLVSGHVLGQLAAETPAPAAV
jgi:hypothetical protein